MEELVKFKLLAHCFAMSFDRNPASDVALVNRACVRSSQPAILEQIIVTVITVAIPTPAVHKECLERCGGRARCLVAVHAGGSFRML